MNSNGIRGAGVACAMALIAASPFACSDDGSTEGGGSGGSGGKGGSSGKGSGGTAGEDSSATGGSAGQAGGAGEAGSAGVGGADGSGASGGTGGGSACLVCAEQNCKAAWDACLANDSCRSWSDCVGACGDAACARACDTANTAKAPASDVYLCLCASCGTECGDIGTCDAECVDDVTLPLMPTPPESLTETGLYEGADTQTPAPYAKPFQPQFVLWSDGAVKTRWAYIPKCSKVDTSDQDHWDIPVGSRFWKEFVRDGVRIETRLIHRWGPGADDWIFAAYQWDQAGVGNASTKYVQSGVQNANGTPHDIPGEGQCRNCHTRLEERILSFSAIQLSHSMPGETMASLSKAGRLSEPKVDGFLVPGNQVERAALGYLHANCGNCHNDNDTIVSMRVRLLVAHTTVAQTHAYTTAINTPTTSFNCLGIGIGTCDRIEPKDPNFSAVMMRMSSRAIGIQMPPIASEISDPTGVAAVTAWISALP